MIRDNGIQLDADLQHRIDELTHVTGLSATDVLREALSEYAASRSNEPRPDRKGSESVYDVLVRTGLLGCIKDGPHDLSTNPIHMEGFGRD